MSLLVYCRALNDVLLLTDKAIFLLSKTQNLSAFTGFLNYKSIPADEIRFQFTWCKRLTCVPKSELLPMSRQQG